MSHDLIFFIYGLRRKGDHLFHYVGKTVDPGGRLRCHLHDIKRSSSLPKSVWIKETMTNGDEIEMVILQECKLDDVDMAEKEWIDSLIRSGHPLKNVVGGVAKRLVRQSVDEDRSFDPLYKRTSLSGPLPKGPGRHARKRSVSFSSKTEGIIREAMALWPFLDRSSAISMMIWEWHRDEMWKSTDAVEGEILEIVKRLEEKSNDTDR